MKKHVFYLAAVVAGCMMLVGCMKEGVVPNGDFNTSKSANSAAGSSSSTTSPVTDYDGPLSFVDIEDWLPGSVWVAYKEYNYPYGIHNGVLITDIDWSTHDGNDTEIHGWSDFIKTHIVYNGLVAFRYLGVRLYNDWVIVPTDTIYFNENYTYRFGLTGSIYGYIQPNRSWTSWSGHLNHPENWTSGTYDISADSIAMLDGKKLVYQISADSLYLDTYHSDQSSCTGTVFVRVQ